MEIPYSIERANFLEEAMKAEIGHHRFLPYLQLHEFEALLFTHLRGFEYCRFPEKQMEQIRGIMEQYENPEDINDHPDTAPSKRLMKIIPAYEKVLHGNIIVQENGFHLLLEKCPRFSKWVDQLKILALL